MLLGSAQNPRAAALRASPHQLMVRLTHFCASLWNNMFFTEFSITYCMRLKFRDLLWLAWPKVVHPDDVICASCGEEHTTWTHRKKKIKINTCTNLLLNAFVHLLLFLTILQSLNHFQMFMANIIKPIAEEHLQYSTFTEKAAGTLECGCLLH